MNIFDAVVVERAEECLDKILYSLRGYYELCVSSLRTEN